MKTIYLVEFGEVGGLIHSVVLADSKEEALKKTVAHKVMPSLYLARPITNEQYEVMVAMTKNKLNTLLNIKS